MSSNAELSQYQALVEHDSSVEQARIRRLSSSSKRVTWQINQVSTDTVDDENEVYDATNGDESNIKSPQINGSVSDEGESTAEEGVMQNVDSSTTDNFPDSIDPIDFIESSPRLSHPHSMVMGGGKGGHQYENWNMFLSERDFEELTRKNKTPLKRFKQLRGGKPDRQRVPHPLPRLSKIKPLRMPTTPRKRRLSGRLARPPQLSIASEEGDMAQADEMGDGEGRDDGFVDCGEAVRKRNRKKQGGVHMLLPSGSPQSSPSTTPISRRRASSRKSRPKPRVKKPSKLAQHASADVSTQESTTQGPGSSDSSEEGLSPHEGANVRMNEDVIDSDSDDLYEDTRSLTPHSPEPLAPSANHRDTPIEPASEAKKVNNNYVADLNSHQSIHMSSKESLRSNSDENFHDSNGTSDTDIRDSFHDSNWKNRRLESDLSTAPFSSETSDMDTSGNERILTANSIPISNRIGPLKTAFPPQVQHHQINSESSGDERARRSRDVRIVPRLPPKPAILQSGQNNKTGQPLTKIPPPAKKPLSFTKNSPIALKPHTTTATSPAKPVNSPARNRANIKASIPNKPKPPVAAKPKPEIKPRPILQQKTLSSVVPNGNGKLPGVSSEPAKPKSLGSPLRKIQSEKDIIKKPPPPVVVSKTRRGSEPVKSITPLELKSATPHVPLNKPAVSPKPGRHKQSLFPLETSCNTVLPVPTSAGSEDASKASSSSSETLSSQSPSNSPYLSPTIKKKPTKPQADILPSKLSIEHSHSSPSLVKSGPHKSTKDTEMSKLIIQTHAQPTPNVCSIDPPSLKDFSHSDLQLTNENESPSPPPVPLRARDSQVELNVPSTRGQRAPSPLMGRSNRRPPPSPPTQQEDSKSPPLPQSSKAVNEPPPVPPHGSKRLSIFSTTLNSTQISTIHQHYEVCDIKPEKSFEDYLNEDIDKPSVTPRTRTPDALREPNGEMGVTAQCRPKEQKPTSRRVPPQPPATVDEAKTERRDPGESEPPLLASGVRNNKGVSHASEGVVPKTNSSPILGRRASDCSTPLIMTAQNASKSNTPRRAYARARRDYEEIDIVKDWEGSSSTTELTLRKPTWSSPNRKAMRPLRNYEEIDVLDDPPPEDDTLTSPPVSPITMVAVTRQTSSSTLKFNSANKIPKLPVEDLRENWIAPGVSSPQVMRRQARSFSSKRGASMMCRRSVSDRFMVKPATLGPNLARNGLYRPSSLDKLNDRMDRLTRNSIHRALSSSEDEDTTVISPTQQQGLPKIPSRDDLYSTKTSTAPREKMEKHYEVSPATEPLYQYINTAEFLQEAPADNSSEAGYSTIPGRKRNQLDVARQLSHRKLWCEQPDVIRSGVLDMLSDEERKLQEAIFEVITSEATYLRSLDVLINHFMDDPGMNPNLPEGRRVLDKRQHHVIFSNVREVREVSAAFLEELQRRQRESAVVRNISDIILDYAANKFGSYVKYCTNQVYQTREMQECLESNMMFREYLRRLERDKICQALNMQSFLLLPMQRITRLPLLVLAILNRTPLDHPDHGIVERTLRTVQKLVTSCNDGARKMERTEQLVEIHKRLEFGKLKPFPLVSASRQLERKGILIELQVEQKLLGKIKVKKIPRYVFVFTDYIIIAKKKKDPKGDCLYKVIDHASRAVVEVEWIESHHGVNFEMDSISRATWAVSQAGDKHAFLVVLLSNAYGHCAKYIFLAQNDTDKTRWMESMKRQDIQKEEEKIYETWDCPQVQAIFDYHGQQPDELDLQRGDVVKVYRKMADGWYEGERLRDLRKGWFPSNFCMEIENEHTRARNLRETHRLRDLTESLQSRIQGSKF